MNSIFQKRICLTQREVRLYLRDELSDDQRYEVENHLLDCELCAGAIEGYAQNPDEGLWEEDVRQLQSKVHLSARNPYLAWANRAAAAVLMLIIGYAAFRYWDASQPERLFAAFFEPAPNAYITLRGTGAEAAAAFPEELKKALEYYEAGAFGLSLPHFSHYLREHPEDSRALFLAASAQLEAGQPEKAEQYLLQLEVLGESFQGQAPWHLALAYLRQGKMAEARRQLEKILATPSSPFLPQARELSEKMK